MRCCICNYLKIIIIVSQEVNDYLNYMTNKISTNAGNCTPTYTFMPNQAHKYGDVLEPACALLPYELELRILLLRSAKDNQPSKIWKNSRQQKQVVMWFSKIDMTSEFLQVKVHLDDQENIVYSRVQFSLLSYQVCASTRCTGVYGRYSVYVCVWSKQYGR